MGWPATGFEQRPWQGSDGDVIVSRRQRMLARGDYAAAVPPFIADAVLRLEADVLAVADDAGRELTRFDTEVGVIAAPFASILLRTESASSSEVENLTSSAKQVALAELNAASSGNARMVVANVRAMNAALDLAFEINEESIISMQKALLGDNAPEHTGRFRDQQVWIGGGSFSPHSASFVPPHHDRVPALMADLIQFCSRTDLPVLVHVAIAHAQFETIHPFPDGNGRTGRALIQSMLRSGEITRNVAVPVSAGLLGSTERYFDSLTAYRRGDPAAIIDALSDAAFRAVGNGRQLVSDLRAISDGWRARVPARAGSTASRLWDLLLKQPVINTKTVAAELGVSETAAQAAIDSLVEHEVLEQTNDYRRNRIWHAPEVLAALDNFGDRARRATPWPA
ncbi:hypothetical protein LEUCIP111803_01804 [Leucobacter soli]|uniref:Fido domain-containing protein n=2 Tax=Leucobacter soli TaxID=2812850 RepID=A0A916K078_9MICO|nr:hypothetical protein LEUCIP111803_01804 [Leucobacter soli]